MIDKLTPEQMSSAAIEMADHLARENGRLREALNAVVNWYTPPNDSNPFPIRIVVDALSSLPRPHRQEGDK